MNPAFPNLKLTGPQLCPDKHGLLSQQWEMIWHRVLSRLSGSGDYDRREKEGGQPGQKASSMLPLCFISSLPLPPHSSASRKVWKWIALMTSLVWKQANHLGNSILHIMVKSMNFGFKCAQFKSWLYHIIYVILIKTPISLFIAGFILYKQDHNCVTSWVVLRSHKIIHQGV